MKKAVTPVAIAEIIAAMAIQWFGSCQKDFTAGSLWSLEPLLLPSEFCAPVAKGLLYCGGLAGCGSAGCFADPQVMLLSRVTTSSP